MLPFSQSQSQQRGPPSSPSSFQTITSSSEANGVMSVFPIRVEDVDGAGRGVFATSDVAVGDVLLRCAPAALVPGDAACLTGAECTHCLGDIRRNGGKCTGASHSSPSHPNAHAHVQTCTHMPRTCTYAHSSLPSVSPTTTLSSPTPRSLQACSILRTVCSRSCSIAPT